MRRLHWADSKFKGFFRTTRKISGALKIKLTASI
jgi:hypothetical protein